MTRRHLRTVQLGDSFAYIGQCVLAERRTTARPQRICGRTMQVAKVAVAETMRVLFSQCNPFIWAQPEG